MPITGYRRKLWDLGAALRDDCVSIFHPFDLHPPVRRGAGLIGLWLSRGRAAAADMISQKLREFADFFRMIFHEVVLLAGIVCQIVELCWLIPGGFFACGLGHQR